LYNRKQALESERDMYNGIVTLLSDFSIPTRRINGLQFYVKQVLPIFLLVTIFLLLLIANRNKIKEVISKY